MRSQMPDAPTISDGKNIPTFIYRQTLFPEVQDKSYTGNGRAAPLRDIGSDTPEAAGGAGCNVSPCSHKRADGGRSSHCDTDDTSTTGFGPLLALDSCYGV